jgi:TPR repeat protein
MEFDADLLQNNSRLTSGSRQSPDWRVKLMRKIQAIFLVAVALLLSSKSWSEDFAKGQDAYFSGDYQTAMTEWQPLADAGQMDGQFGMGLLYANGFGVDMNDDQALKWYGLAADQGHAEAQCNLAVMHANGWGVPQSNEEALKWYTLSAEQGVVEAQVSIAKMHRDGFGTEKNLIQARKWFAVAADLGNVNAGYKLDDLAGHMSAEEIAEGDQLANAWIESHQILQAGQ